MAYYINDKTPTNEILDKLNEAYQARLTEKATAKVGGDAIGLGFTMTSWDKGKGSGTFRNIYGMIVSGVNGEGYSLITPPRGQES